MSTRFAALCRTTLLVLSLSACGGGSGGGAQPQSAALSTGAITAFGSVFVNGHEFDTSHASVIDDDTGAAAPASSLEVGMVVTVKPTSESTDAAPEAAEIHVSPLARGFVDASVASPSTITVMGQTVQLTSATIFSDHRACVSAATPCAAINGQNGLAVSGGAVPGTFVAVHGYLFAPGAGGSAQIVASLISVLDYNAQGSSPSNFKAEGQVTALDASVPSLTIGAEHIGLSQAACRSGGATVACASAFKVGDIVAVRGVTPPAGTAFTADFARVARLLPQTPGATVEVEGKVSSVSGTAFVVRGIQVDGSALTAGQIPAIGDKVEVLGTVASDGQSIKATSIEHDEHAAASRVLLAGPLGGVSAGATTGTFDVVVLGVTATVTADTHIADRTTAVPATFNVTNFQTYLQGKTPYVVVRTVADSTGALRVTGFDIVPAPASGFVGVAGAADAAPTALGGGKSTVAVHGVSLIFDPAKASVSKGSFVVAKGASTPSGIDTTVTDGRLIVLAADGGGDDHEVDIGD
jgi:hypothetical protein